MAYNPNNPNGQASAANSAPVVLDTTDSGYLSAIAASTATTATNTGAQAQDFQSTGTIVANNGTVSVTGQGVYTVTASITGTWVANLLFEGQTTDSNWNAIPINSITGTNLQPIIGPITSNGLYCITGGGYLNVRVRASSYTSGTVSVALDGSLSQQTVLANINTPDSYVVGAAAQTATVNNILTSTSGTAASSAYGFHSAAIQITSTGTGGTYIFEGSNDNVNFVTVPVYNQLILTGTPITAAITATASTIVYVFPITTQYIRCRIATAITGGSIQATTKLSQTTWTPSTFTIANATAANANVTATIASGTVTTVSTVSNITTGTIATVTNSNAGFPGSIADVASAAITTTTTSGPYTPTYGCSYQIIMDVTAVSGTTPTMDVQIIESLDGGTNYRVIYQFPRIAATGSYVSPMIPLTGNRIEYVQTIAGTTPSFTRSISRLQSSSSMAPFIRQIFDRTVTLTTLSSTTAALLAEQQCKNITMSINIGAATIAPALQIQGSDDAGATWYNLGTPLSAVASSTVSTTVTSVAAQQYRAIVTTAGSAVTAGYVMLRAF